MIELLKDILEHNPIVGMFFGVIVALFVGDGLRKRVINFAPPTAGNSIDIQAELQVSKLTNKMLLDRILELERLVREIEHAEVNAA